MWILHVWRLLFNNRELIFLLVVQLSFHSAIACSLFILPPLWRDNWQTMWYFGICMYCEMITSHLLIVLLSVFFLCLEYLGSTLWRNYKYTEPSGGPAHCAVCRFYDIYLPITQSLYPLTNTSQFVLLSAPILWIWPFWYLSPFIYSFTFI